MPGDFEITHAEARGNPPGTAGLDVSWSPSEGAYRYVVGLRPAETPHCFVVNSCSEQGWQLATTDTAVHVTVPAEALEGYEGPWTVDVYAMDEALYQYLTTGTSGNLFPVQAVQNVEGGYGVVGSWVRRSKPLSAPSGEP